MYDLDTAFKPKGVEVSSSAVKSLVCETDELLSLMALKVLLSATGFPDLNCTI